jgi:hypothetical protein
MWNWTEKLVTSKGIDEVLSLKKMPEMADLIIERAWTRSVELPDFE